MKKENKEDDEKKKRFRPLKYWWCELVAPGLQVNFQVSWPKEPPTTGNTNHLNNKNLDSSNQDNILILYHYQLQNLPKSIN